MARKTSSKSEIIFCEPDSSVIVARCEPHGKNLDQAAAALLRTARKWQGRYLETPPFDQRKKVLSELCKYICKYGKMVGKKRLEGEHEFVEMMDDLQGVNFSFEWNPSRNSGLYCPTNDEIYFFHWRSLLDCIQTAHFLANLYAVSVGKREFEERWFKGVRREANEIELPLPPLLSHSPSIDSVSELPPTAYISSPLDVYRLRAGQPEVGGWRCLHVSAETYHFELEEHEAQRMLHVVPARNPSTEDILLARAAFVWCSEQLLSSRVTWDELDGTFKIENETMIAHFLRVLFREGVDFCPYCGNPLIKVTGLRRDYCGDGCMSNDNKKWKKRLERTRDPEAVKREFPHVDPARIEEEMNLYL